MFRTSRANLVFLKRTSLYQTTDTGEQKLYKPGGRTLHEMGVALENLPPRLHILPEEKTTALAEIQTGLNQRLKDQIKSHDTPAVKNTLVNLVGESLQDPTVNLVETTAEAVSTVIHAYMDQAAVLRSMASMTFTDYTTALHAVNVMVLALNFALYHKLPLPRTQDLGLAALLHDVGKTQVPAEILTAARRLTEEEFAQMRSHAVKGYNLLKKNDKVPGRVALAALQHHERVDGSGYPHGISDIPMTSKLIGLVDCYEAITADTRPYRDAMDPFTAMSLIKQDVRAGKIDEKLFEKFVVTLV
ncbi:MAG: HD domain-containing protein [Deltaproteobacteria bacterium]|nr:HD domain-containing protein [Deltaproteobacteria bacterium]MCB2186317.1 HD domain-containing protein [Deltaproteobacteria bacterium]